MSLEEDLVLGNFSDVRRKHTPYLNICCFSQKKLSRGIYNVCRFGSIHVNSQQPLRAPGVHPKPSQWKRLSSMLRNVDAWNHWVEEAKCPPLIPTLKLYQKLQNHGLALIFLSGRHENQRNSTVKNLLHAGYSGWTMLIMRTEDEMQMNVQAYKSKQRLQLESEGLRIKGVIGDQWSDISGPAVGNYTFKLPNPLYNIL